MENNHTPQWGTGSLQRSDSSSLPPDMVCVPRRFLSRAAPHERRRNVSFLCRMTNSPLFHQQANWDRTCHLWRPTIILVPACKKVMISPRERGKIT